jgi:hypothetical protein
VKRLISLAVIGAAVLAQGCATSTQLGISNGDAGLTRSFAGTTNDTSPIVLSQGEKAVVNGAEIGLAKDVPIVEGRPLTAIVVTQCNMVIAVYMTMQDGRLLRFDSKASVPAEQLISIAYTATRSERVEVSCENIGAAGFETHAPM